MCGAKHICWVSIAVVGVRCYFKGSPPVDMTALPSLQETIGPQHDAISVTFYICCSLTFFFIYSTYRCLFYLYFSLSSSSLPLRSFFIILSVLMFFYFFYCWDIEINAFQSFLSQSIWEHVPISAGFQAVVCAAGEHVAPAEPKCISSVQLLSHEGKLYIGLRDRRAQAGPLWTWCQTNVLSKKSSGKNLSFCIVVVQ